MADVSPSTSEVSLFVAPFSSSGVHELAVFLRDRSVSSFPSSSSVPADVVEPFPVRTLRIPLVIARTYPTHYVAALVLFLSF